MSLLAHSENVPFYITVQSITLRITVTELRNYGDSAFNCVEERGRSLFLRATDPSRLVRTRTSG